MPMSKLDKLTHAYEVIFTQYLLQKESDIARNELKELIKSMRQSKVSKFIDAIILSLLTVIVLGTVNLLISLYIG